jgi:hypothetical protein
VTPKGIELLKAQLDFRLKNNSLCCVADDELPAILRDVAFKSILDDRQCSRSASNGVRLSSDEIYGGHKASPFSTHASYSNEGRGCFPEWLIKPQY